MTDVVFSFLITVDKESLRTAQLNNLPQMLKEQNKVDCGFLITAL